MKTVNDLQNNNDRSINDWKNYSLETLIHYVKQYDQRQESINKIMKAYEIAEKAHKGVKRASGKPYISHPVAVANFLAIMRVDIDSICAGLLHDVIEDTPITKKEIEKQFGRDVAEIVEGVTKISNLDEVDYSSLKLSLDAQDPESLRMLNKKKIIDSLLYDPRIIIVKLADRLHNMLTIGYKTPVKQKSKAAETLELYVPLANKLGIYRIQQELEDASLRCIDPYIYNRLVIIREKIKADCTQFLDEMLDDMIKDIDKNLKIIGHYDQSELDKKDREELLKETVFKGKEASRTRIKHIYGIYDAIRKMQPEESEEDISAYLSRMLFDKENFEAIHDLRVIKLIMKDEDSCYSLIRFIHQRYGNVQNRFKDYIYNPKYNMYKSLHTTVSTKGKYVQFQIRTLEQEYRNTFGLAWELYKYSGKNAREKILKEFKKYPAYQKLIDIKENRAVSDLESYQSLINKEILNTREITVINKENGKNVTIRNDATIRDFAYLIGGPLGDHLVRATLNDVVYELEINNGVVNESVQPFNIRLHDGDEISVEFNKKIWCPRQSTDIEKKTETQSKTLKLENKKMEE
jgi:GTP pyrophosphokinase